MDTGALVKDYEDADKEVRVALQMAVTQVTFEDERYIVSLVWVSICVSADATQEQAAPPIGEEFPDGEKVIFLGRMAYGTAAQVMGSKENSLDLGLAVRLVWFP